MTKFQKIILATILASAVFLIIFRFAETPVVWTDEGVFTETARNLAVHGVLGLQTAPGQFFSMRNFLLSTGYPVIFPVALSFKLFGVGLWQARLPMLIYMFLLVLVFYLFTKKKYGFWPAIASVLLLLSFAPFYGNGRPVQGEVPGLFFLVLGLWLLLHFEESDFKEDISALLAGLAFGLSASVKLNFLGGIILSLILALCVTGKIISSRKNFIPFFFGFLIPVCVWFFTVVSSYKDVINFIPSLISFFRRHASSMPISETILTNGMRFATESTPVLFSFLAVIIGFYILWRLIKKKKCFTFSEVAAFTFIIISFVEYLISPGWYRYFFPPHVLLYLFFPAAVLSLGEYANKRVVAVGVLVAIIIFQFGYLTFYSQNSFIRSSPRNAQLHALLSGVPTGKNILFYGDMETAIFFNSDNYYQYYSLGGFLDTGNKNTILNPNTDYILSEAENRVIPCYTRVDVSRYEFFTKTKGCKNK